MNISKVSASAALAGAALALTVATVPASAATTGTWFYASQGSKLVKVELVGTKITSSKVLSSSSNTNVLYEPTSALGSFAAGMRGLYNSSTHQYANVLFTYDSAHSKFRVLTSTAHDQVLWAALYNSGKSVAFIDKTGAKYKIREVASTGGTASTKWTAPAGMSLTSLAVSHDGRTFYFGGTTSAGGRVYSATAGVAKTHALTVAIKKADMTAMSLSPSGVTVAYSPAVFPPTKTNIRLVKVASGGVTKSISYQGVASTTSWSANGATIYNADQAANGWFKDTVSTGKSSSLDFNSTGHYLYPVRA